MRNKVSVVTHAECEAYRLLHGGWVSTAHNAQTVHDAADRIIELAERIKAQRAVVAMEPPCAD